MSDELAIRRSSWKGLFRRGPAETLATVVIGAGILMMTQPFSIDLFTYSFVTILAGTIAFIAVSHFPD
jgi:hypothetical protein